MTDNFSNNFEQRVFSTETPPAICEKYARLPQVEDQITEVLQLSEDELIERLAVKNRASEKFLREETLVCLLTLAHREKLFRIESIIAEKLFSICEKNVRKSLRDRPFDQDFVEETIGELRWKMLDQFFNRRHESYDFWEKYFYKALKSLLYAHLRKHSGAHLSTDLFSELGGADDETDYESNLESGGNLAKDFEAKETGRKILAKMPEDWRKIFVLYYLDGETQRTIAETLGVTDRTVRNKLEKIGEFLSEWRGADGEKR